jgi:hypothetical protein
MAPSPIQDLEPFATYANIAHRFCQGNIPLEKIEVCVKVWAYDKEEFLPYNKI